MEPGGNERAERFPEIHVVCCYCHRLLIQDGSWIEAPERMIQDPALRISHGLCPDCAEAIDGAQGGK